MLAAKGGHTNTARTLLEGWANPGLWNGKACAFVMALSNGRTNTAQIIREYLPPVLHAQMRQAMEEACKAAPVCHRPYMNGWLQIKPPAATV